MIRQIIMAGLLGIGSRVYADDHRCTNGIHAELPQIPLERIDRCLTILKQFNDQHALLCLERFSYIEYCLTVGQMHDLFFHPTIRQIIGDMRQQKCIDPLVDGWDKFLHQSISDADIFVQEFSCIIYVVLHILLHGCNACIEHNKSKHTPIA